MASANSNIIKSIDKLVIDTRKATVTEFYDYIVEKMSEEFSEEFADDLSELCNAFKQSVQIKVPDSQKKKTKRQPTAYNLFVREKMAEMRAKHAELHENDGVKFDGRGAMSEAAKMYSAIKKSGKVEVPKPEDPESDKSEEPEPEKQKQKKVSKTKELKHRKPRSPKAKPKKIIEEDVSSSSSSIC